MNFLTHFLFAIFGDAASDRVVPPSGASARLTLFVAAVMAFLAVFALAMSLASGRLADRWSDALARSVTIRIAAPLGEEEAQTRAVLTVLSQTPGVAEARALTDEEQRALLAPWFGPDLPLDRLPIPRLVTAQEVGDGIDITGLRQRLAAEAPAATIDDHDRWRRPLVEAAGALRLLGYGALVLILAALAAMVSLAAQAALASNASVIRVLRLVGARDGYIAGAFVRRFTLRGFSGAALGAGIGMIALAFIPDAPTEGMLLTGLGFEGAQWLLPLALPLLSALIAFHATRRAALVHLGRLP